MRVQSTSLYNNMCSFRAATLNLNALSDTHGELLLTNNALEELRKRQKDVFVPQVKGKTNVTAICGDWFIDGARTGYRTNPTRKNAWFQLAIFNEFIKQIKEIAPNNVSLFSLGNHEFDGGIDLLAEVLEKIDAQVLISNLDMENSPAFETTIKDGNIVSERVLKIEDDKNPELKHKVLFLGVAPINLPAYQKNLDGLSFVNGVAKSQSKVTKEDYQETLDLFKQKIADFKADNKNGLVILMSHTGVRFAENLAKESAVDLVLDGHEHKDDIRVVNGTPIVPLSQNFKKLVNARFEIDDNGKVDSLVIKSFSPLENKIKGPLARLYRKLFREDIKKIYTIYSGNEKIKTLDTKNIRTGNNYLANFVTDAILSEIKKKDSSVDFFALNSAAIRQDLKLSDKPSVSSFDVLGVLSGIKEEDGQILVNEVSGKEFAYMIIDNLVFNRQLTGKNPLVHYSGIKIDRTKILEAFDNDEPFESLIRYITDIRTGEPLKFDKTYKVANTEKYFNKSDNPYIREMKNKSWYLGHSIQELFRAHFESSRGFLRAKCDVRIS